jgi:hypothetical protein
VDIALYNIKTVLTVKTIIPDYTVQSGANFVEKLSPFISIYYSSFENYDL